MKKSDENKKDVKNEEALIAEVAVEKVMYGCDSLYSYLVPDELKKSVWRGQRVIVPFGKGNSKRTAIILNVRSNKEGNNEKLKSIYTVLDKTSIISDEMILLIEWIKNRCFCSYFEAAKLVFPVGLSKGPDNIKYNINSEALGSCQNLSANEREFLNKAESLNKKILSLRQIMGFNIKNQNKILTSLLSKNILSEELSDFKTVGEKLTKFFALPSSKNVYEISLTVNQKKVYDFLQNVKKASLKDINYFTGVGASVVDALCKKGIVEESKCLEYKSPSAQEVSDHNEPQKTHILSEEQQCVFEKLLKDFKDSKPGVSLLYGITGSGKTAVLLKLVDYVISQNRSALFLVPEIALTAQFIGIFKSRYKNLAAVIHSGLSNWERLDTWKKIKSGKIKVVLGTRSAVFSPVENIGLIIIDEEHEFTYKSESSPRFNAKDIAKERCKYHNAMLILSSATPSIESYFKAKSGKYKLYCLKNRYGLAKIPKVQIVDMNKEAPNVVVTQFSTELIEKLKENIKNKKQSIIFLNRRGYNTFAKCRSCNEVLTCPHCSVSLNYHKANNRLMCHYCGYSCGLLSDCPHCGQNEICYLGAGTQKAEDILSDLIPNARILRMDSDSKNSKKPYQKALRDFEEGKYDILLGTQMISKGFNFPNVTLVGVLSADQYLYSGDFRSYEKTFSLITQVVGRSGRDKFQGEAIIQTFTPESEVLRFAALQDYEGFFKDEIKIRKMMLYPPFVDICAVGFIGTSEKKVMEASGEFFENIKKTAAEKYSDLPLRIFSPVPASIKKIAEKYRYAVIVKCRNDKSFRAMMSEMLIKFHRNFSSRGVHIFMDINPDTIL